MSESNIGAPAYVVQAVQRAEEALAEIPGVIGHVVILRDPDGPSKLPGAAIAHLDGDDDDVAHASYHALEAMILSDRPKPRDLAAPVADLLRERLEAWAAGAAELIEAHVAEAPERARALLVKYGATDKALVDAYVAQASDTTRTVAAGVISGMREDLARSLDLLAAGAASLVWDRATGPICGGGSHGE